MSSQPYPVSQAKARFSEFVREASLGFEVVSTNKHGSGSLVSLVRTDILTAALDALTLTLTETTDDELGVITIAVADIPIYGEGVSREAAVHSLLDAAIDYTTVYRERIELFSHTDSPRTQALMIKLLRCEGDRVALRKALGL
ncbi:MAG: hypothetical protein DDT20_01474 [Firmicutes bacterium]|nr:hypothetical protein [Bacillota bacterium]